MLSAEIQRPIQLLMLIVHNFPVVFLQQRNVLKRIQINVTQTKQAVGSTLLIEVPVC